MKITENEKRFILDFIKQHNIAVVATCITNKPQAAVVEYGEQDNLDIIIDTFKGSRKCKNLRINNSASIVIGWDDDKTLQIDAIARELIGASSNVAKQAYFAKNPRARKWDNRPEITYFSFTPTWIR